LVSNKLWLDTKNKANGAPDKNIYIISIEIGLD
jgi:hypothetical protein